jgi:hypothetical protein
VQQPIAAESNLLQKGEFGSRLCENGIVRSTVAVFAAVLTAGSVVAAPSAAADNDPTDCNYPSCTPGIMPNVVLGSYCNNPTYYAFGVTSWGRLVFCGSPRRYEPRWFRSPEMHGVKNEGDLCPAFDGEVAQAPDGLFLTCVAADGASRWTRGDT